MARAEIRYRLPETLRDRLKRPLADVVDEPGLLELERAGRLGRPLVCVGDIVCDTLLRRGLDPQVLIFDLSTQRGEIPADVAGRLLGHDAALVKVPNPAATVTAELEAAIQQAFDRDAPTRIQVDGEEDLAGLPAIFHAPEGATVIYGMPNQGLVPVPVTKQNRERAGALLSLMKVGAAEQAGPTEGG